MNIKNFKSQARSLVATLLEGTDEELNGFILNWFQNMLRSMGPRGRWVIPETGQIYQFDKANRTVTLVQGSPVDEHGSHRECKRYLEALGYTVYDAPPGSDDEMAFVESMANLLVNMLLEVSEMPSNPVADRTYRQWREKGRWDASSVPLAFRKIKEFERGMDASGRSMEGEPSPEELRREYAKTRKFDPVPRTPRNSVTMATNRNQRRKALGYSDHRYSMRDLKWPTDPAYHRKLREPLPEPPEI